ncbi:DSBA oxidoreductase, partial [Stenotrophomonas maltophilia]
RDNFLWVQLLQVFAQPMAVLPLLMLATGGLAPQDGPFASAWFNTVKGFAAVLAGGVLDAIAQGRRHSIPPCWSTALASNRGWPMARSWARACMHRYRR